MNEIYLISSEGYRESINLDYYCITDEELKNTCVKDFNEYYYGSIINYVSVSLNERDEKIVIIYYYNDWDINKEFLEHKKYYTFKLNKYVCN